MSDTLVLDRIESNLTRLRLSRIQEILESVLKAAEKHDKSHLSFLDELLEEEVAYKEQRRVEIALKISGLPFIKSIDDYKLLKKIFFPNVFSQCSDLTSFPPNFE